MPAQDQVNRLSVKKSLLSCFDCCRLFGRLLRSGFFSCLLFGLGFGFFFGLFTRNARGFSASGVRFGRIVNEFLLRSLHDSDAAEHHDRLDAFALGILAGNSVDKLGALAVSHAEVMGTLVEEFAQLQLLVDILTRTGNAVEVVVDLF